MPEAPQRAVLAAHGDEELGDEQLGDEELDDEVADDPAYTGAGRGLGVLMVVAGALGLLAIVLLKVGALLTLGPLWWLGTLLAPMWGRWADIYGIFFFPAAREGGMGRTFHDQVRRVDFVIATVSALAGTGSRVT